MEGIDGQFLHFRAVLDDCLVGFNKKISDVCLIFGC